MRNRINGIYEPFNIYILLSRATLFSNKISSVKGRTTSLPGSS